MVNRTDQLRTHKKAENTAELRTLNYAWGMSVQVVILELNSFMGVISDGTANWWDKPF